MVKVTYKPEPGSDQNTSQFGYDFEGSKSVDVTDEAHLAKFRGNRFFKVAGAKDEDHSEQDHAEAKDDLAEQEASREPQPTALKAEHHGGGKFNVTRGEEVVIKGLSKADADAFNALSDEDKAEYVATAKTE